MIKISIIIPIYNAQAYIEIPIKSLMQQTFEDFEVILVNDGSTDNTLAIIEDLIACDKRFKLITQENKGAGGARNRGISASAGQYISFLDSDDYFDDTFLEKMYHKISEENADIAICDFETVTESHQSIQKYVIPHTSSLTPDKAFVALMEGSHISNISANKLFRKELFDGIAYPENIILGEDTATIYKLILQAKKIVFVNEILFFYVYHIDSSVNSFHLSRIDDLSFVSESIKQFMIDNKLYNKYQQAFYTFYLTDIAFGMAFKIAKFTGDKKILKTYVSKLDKDIFIIKNILLLAKNHKRKMVALYLLKSNLTLFIQVVKLWVIKNHKKINFGEDRA